MWKACSMVRNLYYNGFFIGYLKNKLVCVEKFSRFDSSQNVKDVYLWYFVFQVFASKY